MSLIDQFVACTDPESLSEQLTREWTLALHAEALEKVSPASHDHVVVYLQVLVATKGGRAYQVRHDELMNIADLALPLLLRHGMPKSGGSSAEIIARLSITWLLALGKIDDAAEGLGALSDEIRESLPKSLRTTVKSPTKAQGVLRHIASGEIVEEQAFLSFARSRTQQLSLWALVGEPGRSSVFLVPESGPMVWFDGEAFHHSPIELHRSDKTYGFITGDTPLDERLLYWAGTHVWSLLQRYGDVVLLQETTYYTSRREAWPNVDAVVDCKDPVWTQRLVDAFTGSRPKSQRRVDPYLEPGKSQLYVRQYHDELFHTRPGRASGGSYGAWEREFSRGVQSESVVTGGYQPGVLQLNMKEDAERKVTLVEGYDNHASAAAAFEADELEHLARGFSICKIIALPVREIEVPYRLTVDGDSRETLDKLRTLLNSKDAAQERQAESLILSLAEPTVDRWILETLDERTSNACFGTDFGLYAGRIPRGAERIDVRRLCGTPRLDSGRLLQLVKRSGPDDEKVKALRSIRRLVAGTGRLQGHWRVPLHLADIDALVDLELLILECSGERGAQTPLRGLEHLARLPKLRGLVIRGAEHVDLEPLADAKGLTFVQLIGSGVSGLEALVSSRLETLRIDQCTGEDIGALPATLQWLNVMHAKVPFEVDFASLPELRHLQLHTASGSLAGVDACRRLERVDLRGCPWVEETAVFELLVREGNLRALALNETGVPIHTLPEAIREIVTYAELPNLDHMIDARTSA